MTADALTRAFSNLLRARPQAPALLSPSRSVTVAELAALVRAASGRLGMEGLPAGCLVGLVAPNGSAFPASFLALREAGMAALLLDPVSPPADRQATCSALGARALFECKAAWPQSPDAWTLTRVPGDERPLSVDTAAVKLTSGSTGAPRGVAVTADALLADDAALARTMGLRVEDRILGAIPMSHSYGFASVILPMLVRGSATVVPDEAGPWSALLAAEAAAATVFPTAPAYLQALLKTAIPLPWPSSIRLVISASAPLPPVVALRFRERYRLPVHVFYGASECGGIAYDRDGTAGERGTVGTAVDGVRVLIEPVEGGTEGEGIVTVASAAVAVGYVPDPDPRLGDGLFSASDLARFENGELRLLGRVDALINVKGRKVNPAEIERLLLEMQGVEDVLVLGIQDGDRGEMVRAVVACPSGRVSAAGVVAFCRGRLPEHKVPRSVVLVDALPRTSRGKPHRADIQKIAESGDRAW